MPSDRKCQTIRDLEYVLELCAEIKRGGRGAFRRVAASVQENPSAITMAVNRVEKYVGRALLERTQKGSRKSMLTPFGESYSKLCPDVLRAWDRLERSMSSAEDAPV